MLCVFHGALFSFNLDNGYLNWEKNIVSKNTPIIDGNNVFIVSDNGYFVNLNRSSGKIIWAMAAIKITSPRIPKPKTAERLLEYLSQKSAIFMLAQCGGLGMNK